jgi:LysM repeat protein
LFVIALLCIIGIALFYFQGRAKAFNSRPLVLIHSPINHDLVRVGEGVAVHATAREDRGLRDIELWVDDRLVEVRDAPQSVTNLTLSSNWIPSRAGTHVLVVRATSTDGVEGQSTVRVQVSDVVEPQTHTMQEGETPDSIAADYGVSLEDLSASNPELGSAAPGDELVIPEEEAPADAAPPPVESGEPPADEGAAPGSSDPLSELLGPFFAIPFQEQATLTTLRLEITNLETSQSFDGLHCYVGLADGSPQWFPDADDDQTTDESFVWLGGGRWDVAPYLAGDGALVIVWPDNELLPVNLSCVGITGGGTDAIEFGQLGVDILPEHWDGVTRSIWAEGAAGRIQVDYLVRRGDTPPRGIPLWLDETMTMPANIHLDEPSRSLRWEYHPRADEEAVTGFRIYLNGNLQWVEPSWARQTRLPVEWFHPPCGSTYRFTVTAFRLDSSAAPDGPESMPGFASVETPMDGCQREFLVTFRSLETFNLGSDGDHEDRGGDVGPPYGYFYANDRGFTFDTGDLGAGLDTPAGLSHNSTYDLGDLWIDPGWGFSDPPVLRVDIPDRGSLQFGFHIDNENSGICGNYYTRGCDRLICEGDSARYSADDDALERGFDGELRSEDGRCVVYFTVGPASDSPVGSGVEGAEPLPWIDVQDVIFDAQTGSVRVLIENTGYATWPWKDLDVDLLTRSGDLITRKTWQQFVLGRGEETMLEFPAGTLERPYDACVSIDPDDKVLEHFERSGALSHGRFCLQLPDLIVTDAHYRDGTIHLMIQNVGEGALVNRSIMVEAHLLDGEPPNKVNSLPNVTLEPGDSITMQIGGIDQAFRERMRGGYSVVVNLDAAIAESDTSNNAYVVPAADRLWIFWKSIEVPEPYKDRTSFYFEAYAVSGGTRRQVANWSLEEDIEDWTVCWPESQQCNRSNGNNEFNSGWFDIYGDESLEISILRLSSAHYPNGIESLETFGQEDGWGGGAVTSGVFVGQDPACYSLSPGMPGYHHVIFGYDDDGNTWEAVYNICLASAGE